MSNRTLVITVSLNPAIDRILEVPRLKLGAHQRGRLIARLPAGKAVNVSRALALLGVANVATGFVGEEDLDRFERSFDETHVRPQFLTLPGATRENVTLIDPVNHVETHIRDIGLAVGDKDKNRLARKLGLLCRAGSVVVFSGSMPEGFVADDFVKLIEICLSAKARVAVDTSGPALRAAAKMPLWLLKPNAAELEEIAERPLPTEADLIAAGRELSAGIETVLVSRGSEGGLCFVDGAVLKGQVDVRPDRIRNTVGCGDCLLAGFIAARLEREDIRESYRYALAAATAAAVSVESSRFLRQDVEEFHEKASVEPVDVADPQA